MSDSNVRDRLDAKHERNRERRIEAVKRWVEYVRSEPPEKWGPQQNTVVDDQLAAARSVQLPVSHQEHVETVARDILDGHDDTDEEST